MTFKIIGNSFNRKVHLHIRHEIQSHPQGSVAGLSLTNFTSKGKDYLIFIVCLNLLFKGYLYNHNPSHIIEKISTVCQVFVERKPIISKSLLCNLFQTSK